MRILIVDDEREIISVLREWLSDKGHKVVGITGGAHTVSWVQNGPFDIVLLDVKLPDIDGLSIVADLVKVGAKVIVMSGQAEESWMPIALQSGASGCLAKPIVFSNLERILEGIEITEKPASS
jgi:DNA-binding response OmpR family regulator